MDLKNILKLLKLNENKISTAIGLGVILLLGILVINYFRNLPTGTTLPTGVKTEVEEGLGNKHKVVKGETLWSIAQKYYKDGYSWVEIAKANNLVNPDVIEEGTELVIPEVEKAEGVVSPTPTPAKQVADQPAQKLISIEGTRYIVQKGDHLWKIATEAYGDGYKWVEIARENKLKNPNIIHPGNELILPR